MDRNVMWEKLAGMSDVAAAYLCEPDNYVRRFQVNINGKLRHLVTYMPTAEGRSLRELHTVFARYLQSRYKHARSSFAYTKGMNIKGCIECHLYGTVFLKTDIHSYFDSVTFENMMKRMKLLREPKDRMETLARITQACFYNDRLPLGFTSSPVLSDYYLAALDRQYQKMDGITYTRYADDYIVSAKGPNATENLNLFLLRMGRDLAALGLELNRKKTYVRHLNKPGDAIHVLGVNIVRTDYDRNRVTVSDRYIRKVCRNLCDWITTENREKNDEETFLRLNGQIAFIKNHSMGSYDKLRKMTRIKCGYDGPITAKALRGFQTDSEQK